MTAKQDCAEDGKRLPEASEWQYACKNNPGGAINNMTDDWEYVSNTAFAETIGSTIDIETMMMGNGSCIYGNVHVVARNTGGEDSNRVYRCVR